MIWKSLHILLRFSICPCHRKRPEYKNHIWSYDFLSERLENGRLVKLLVVIDKYTRECLAIDVNPSLRSQDVIEVLRYLFAVRGEPLFIRSVTTVWSLSPQR